MSQSSSLLVAQITDLHLFSSIEQRLLGLPTVDSFQAVIQAIQALERRPDLLLLTGDLAQDYQPESYEMLQEQLGHLQIPTYWVPGNHDCAETMAQVLKRSPFSAQKSFEAGGWQFLLLNSQVPGRVYGALSPESLAWLDQELAQASNRPAIVAFHHPPFRVQSDWLDTSTLQNPDDLFAILDRHPQVKLVVFGHIHQEYSRQRQQVHYLGTPSTCIQFEPNSHDFALDDQSPGFRLLTLYPDGNWHSNVRRTTYNHTPDLAATGY